MKTTGGQFPVMLLCSAFPIRRITLTVFLFCRKTTNDKIVIIFTYLLPPTSWPNHCCFSRVKPRVKVAPAPCKKKTTLCFLGPEVGQCQTYGTKTTKKCRGGGFLPQTWEHSIPHLCPVHRGREDGGESRRVPFVFSFLCLCLTS